MVSTEYARETHVTFSNLFLFLCLRGHIDGALEIDQDLGSQRWPSWVGKDRVARGNVETINIDKNKKKGKDLCEFYYSGNKDVRKK